MLNTSKLRGIIAEKGYSQAQVANKIGMTDRTFYRKMKEGVFGLDEAEKLIQLLDIEDPSSVFFAQEVTGKDTRRRGVIHGIHGQACRVD